MPNLRFDDAAFRRLVLVLIVTGAVGWVARRRWTDHDVSDPGVTL